ncbi:unnamed protein product [Brassicogethes aeneus]|uniref:SAM domain-containing protein n=1 Tax=Brassicogethes aeneus TaxID=1431903 RepID=A0A9P0AKI4_BRAAE|nr:unnamed protein product [Brassicogethes aeneus]
MDIIDTVLHSCRAEKYIDKFKEHGVTDMHTLKVLSYEDLKIILGDEDELNQKVLNTINNLQLPTEKTISRVIDKEYVSLVLSQISLQMHKHFANLAIAARREDVVVCDIKLKPTVLCLNESLKSLEKTLNKFDKNVVGRRKKNMIKYVVPVILVTSLLIFACKKFIKL